MKFAYVILAHKLPEQLYRLVSRLDDRDSVFVIHLCKNTSEQDFEKTNELFKNKQNVFFCKREDGSWGEFGIVQAVLNGMELLLNKEVEFDYLHLISGNDYPIKSNEFLKNFFKKNNGKQYLWYLPVYDYVPLGLPEGAIYGEGWNGNEHPWPLTQRFVRFEKYWFTVCDERLMTVPEQRFIDKPLLAVLKIFLYNMPDYFKKNIIRREFLLMILSITYRESRRLPEGYKLYLGSQWFSITKGCMEYILKTHHANPSFKKYFRHTLLPDESFFTTILANSHFKDNIEQNNYRFIMWPRHNPTHPEVLILKNFPALRDSYKLFARKFDMHEDHEILNMIDKEILKCHELKNN